MDRNLSLYLWRLRTRESLLNKKSVDGDLQRQLYGLKRSARMAFLKQPENKQSGLCRSVFSGRPIVERTLLIPYILALLY